MSFAPQGDRPVTHGLVEMKFFANRQPSPLVTSPSHVPLGNRPSALSCCAPASSAWGCGFTGILSLPSRLGDSGSNKPLSAGTGAPSLIPSLFLSHGLGWGLESDEQVGSCWPYWTSRTEHSWGQVPCLGPRGARSHVGGPGHGLAPCTWGTSPGLELLSLSMQLQPAHLE